MADDFNRLLLEHKEEASPAFLAKPPNRQGDANASAQRGLARPRGGVVAKPSHDVTVPADRALNIATLLHTDAAATKRPREANFHGTADAASSPSSEDSIVKKQPNSRQQGLTRTLVHAAVTDWLTLPTMPESAHRGTAESSWPPWQFWPVLLPSTSIAVRNLRQCVDAPASQSHESFLQRQLLPAPSSERLDTSHASRRLLQAFYRRWYALETTPPPHDSLAVTRFCDVPIDSEARTFTQRYRIVAAGGDLFHPAHRLLARISNPEVRWSVDDDTQRLSYAALHTTSLDHAAVVTTSEPSKVSTVDPFLARVDDSRRTDEAPPLTSVSGQRTAVFSHAPTDDDLSDILGM